MIPTPTPEQVRQHERTAFLSMMRFVEDAKRLQRKGLTFSEIAAEMEVSREVIVNVLYWERVW